MGDTISPHGFRENVPLSTLKEKTKNKVHPGAEYRNRNNEQRNNEKNSKET